MVKRSLSNCSSVESDVSGDDGSSRTSEDENNKEVVLSVAAKTESPSFGNIAVTNSTDVHFGHKTFYQGPVTIKQFLYANSQASNDELCGNGDNKLPIKDSDVIPSISVNVDCKDNPAFGSDTNVINGIDKKIFRENAHQLAEVKVGTQWQRFQNFSRQHLVLAISLTAILLVSLITLMSVLLTRHQGGTIKYPTDTDEQLSGSPADYPIDVNTTNHYVTREGWKAMPANEGRNNLTTPVPYVIIMHTATENCTTLPLCIETVQGVQSFHRDSRKWSDIGYNFLVGGDLNVYEGRGWKYEGAHTYGYNAKSIGIAFIGTFNAYMPSKKQIELTQKLIQKGVDLGYIDKDYKLFAARQLQATQSPGFLLYEDVKTWAHWAESP